VRRTGHHIAGRRWTTPAPDAISPLPCPICPSPS
jgi:hypothetical protein